MPKIALFPILGFLLLMGFGVFIYDKQRRAREERVDRALTELALIDQQLAEMGKQGKSAADRVRVQMAGKYTAADGAEYPALFLFCPGGGDSNRKLERLVPNGQSKIAVFACDHTEPFEDRDIVEIHQGTEARERLEAEQRVLQKQLVKDGADPG
jgi:hypothetical protein